jgi:hypothetical protein
VTEAQLRTELEDGKTLAQVAHAHGKSVAGLVDALVTDAKNRLDASVAAGRLTKKQADEMLGRLRDRITARVNSAAPNGDHFRGPPDGFRRFGKPLGH